MKSIVYLIVLITALGMASSPELQRAEVVFPEQNWSRGNLFASPTMDERKVSAFTKPDLKLKWAIVSGNFGESIDRVRARVFFNGEKWIDLHARKDAFGSYDQNIVSLREIKSGDVKAPKEVLPDLRIVDWSHDALLIKLTANDKDTDFNDTYFRFDLSQSLPN